MNSSETLLQKFRADANEGAFRQLVEDYLKLVQGTALRRVNGDEALAKDITQMVFTDLVKQAKTLPKDVMLGGWLHAHTCFVASNVLRAENRRLARERISAEMSALDRINQQHAWQEIAPVLDEAIQQLKPADQSAILMRFFEGRDLRAIGEALQVSEDAAQKRVQRAVQKLKELLESKGVAVAAPLLWTLLEEQAVAGTGTILAAEIAASALAGVSAGSKTVPLLLLHIMKIKVAFVALLLGIAAFLMIQQATKKDGDSRYLSQSTSRTSPVDAGADLTTQGTLSGANSHAQDPNSLSSEELEKSADSNKVSASEPSVPPLRFLVVRILDKISAKPLRAVSVSVSASNVGPDVAMDKNFVPVSDPDGLARIPIYDENARLQLRFSRNGYSSWVSIYEGDKEKIPNETTVHLDPCVLIGGTVLDSLQNPIPGARVRVNRIWRGGDRVDRSSQRIEMQSATNFTDSAGRWTSTNVPGSLVNNFQLQFSHPDFASTTVSSEFELLPVLRDLKHLVTLRNGARLFGHVTDTNNNPVAGAKVFYGNQYRVYRQETISDSQGYFEFKNASKPENEEEVPVTVSATGYAPQVQHTRLQQDVESFTFKLLPGTTIRGRVVNAKGEAVQGARISWENSQVTELHGLEWSATTDAEGHFEWNGAPATPQSFTIGHGGYKQLRGKVLAPGEQEHVITLSNKSTVRGTVRNASNGALIKKFAVMPAEGTVQNLSSYTESSEREFTDGTFSIEVGEENETIIRIRAAGFASKNFQIPTIENELIDARLEPISGINGVVVDNHGSPVLGAEVGIATDESRALALMRGRFRADSSNAFITHSEERGEFHLEPQGKVKWIFAAAPNGFGVSTLEDLQKTKTIVLQPWSRIEGVYLLDGKPAAGQQVALSPKLADLNNLRFDLGTFMKKTDEHGRFSFDPVPPGVMRLSSIVPHEPVLGLPGSQAAVGRSFLFTNHLEIKLEPGIGTNVVYTVPQR